MDTDATVTYRIVRMFQDERIKSQIVKKGLSLEQAQSWCRNPETSSKTAKLRRNVRRTQVLGPWFDGYEQEK